MAGLLLLAIFLPPLSTEDRTLSMESSIFTSWAQLQDALNHQGPVGTGNGTGGGTTGFSTSAGLGGPLKTTKNVVFTYTVSNTYVGPAYFRGVNLTDTQSGIWFYPSTKGINTPMLKNQPVDYADTYSSKMATATFRITMLSPPRGAGDILFYPGQLVSVDRSTIATETYPAGPTGSDALATVDRLVTTNPPSSRGVYSVTVEYPDVGVSDLQSAGQDYPQWLAPYMTVDDSGRYRDPAVLKRIQTFTEGLVSKAGATNPYDKAVAIETFLRGVLFHYTLTPPVPTDLGTDPLDYFLFTSRQGYCQYFATAMADMLRSLGIPVRLVNGYGPGNAPLNSSGVWTVRDSDAHTWPEVFFPTYGWIPFEPTNDNLGTWNPIQHEVQNGPNICTADNHCPAGGATPSASPRPGGQRPGVDEPLGPAGGAAAGGFRLQMPDAGTLTRLIGILLAVVLLVVAVVARYLRPRTVMGVWNRTMVLARLAGSRLQPGETPFEWSRRVSGLFPDAGPPLRDLTRAFVVAAYGPPDVALSARSSVMDAWVSLRPLLLREVTTRLRRRRS
jgi:transglutaminase-like putative cysteine protease